VPPDRVPGPPEREVTSLARGRRPSLRLQNVSGRRPSTEGGDRNISRNRNKVKWVG
jgi:hypothetical protein